MGSTAFYSSESLDLFSFFSLNQAPTFLIFKDNSLQPADLLVISDINRNNQNTISSNWLRTFKLPTLTELSSSTYTDIMQTGDQSPLVGLILLQPTASNFIQLKSSAQVLAQNWRKRREVGKRNVIWVWIDSDKWNNWISRMYGVQTDQIGSNGLILIADPKVCFKPFVFLSLCVCC